MGLSSSEKPFSQVYNEISLLVSNHVCSERFLSFFFFVRFLPEKKTQRRRDEHEPNIVISGSISAYGPGATSVSALRIDQHVVNVRGSRVSLVHKELEDLSAFICGGLQCHFNLEVQYEMSVCFFQP